MKKTTQLNTKHKIKIVFNLEGVEMVMPGDNVELTVELIAPIAFENGTKFSIREGGRTVGAGNVSEVIE